MRNSVPIKLDIQAKKKQFNKENVDILSEFCLYLKSTGKSPLTIKGYINDIEMFFVWNLEENNNKMFVDFKKREIIRFQAYFLNEKFIFL